MNPNRDKYPDPTAKKVERSMTAEEKEVDILFCSYGERRDKDGV